MSQQAKALTKAGWILVRTKKRGMFKMAWWLDPQRVPGAASEPQAFAYAIMRSRQRRVKPCAADGAVSPDQSVTG